MIPPLLRENRPFRRLWTGQTVVSGLGVMMLDISVGSIFQAVVPDRLRAWIATLGALGGVLFLLPSPVVRLRELPEPAE